MNNKNFSQLFEYGDFTLDRSGPLGAPISITQGNGQWQKSYDNLGRLQAEALKVGGNVKLQFEYAYNTAGRLISRIETESTGNIRTVLFTYDRDGQLLEVTENGVSAETNIYDMNGNRTSRKVGTNTRAATYDAKDRLIAQANLNYVFDADGFLKSRGSDTFTYGTRGELLSANVGGVAVSYVYDTQARLVARTQGSSKIEFLYGNLGEPFQLTAVKEAGVLTYHHYDPSGRLMAFDRGGVRYFVQTDQVGTPRVVTDAAGNVLKQIRTSAFGEVLSDSAPAFKMYVGYAGGIGESLTGLVRFGFRDYEPLSGRWTARDPILFEGGQGNLYVYVGNNVVGARDPSGLQTLTIGGQCSFAIPSGGAEIGAGLYFGRKADGTFDAGLYGSVGYAVGVGVGAKVPH